MSQRESTTELGLLVPPGVGDLAPIRRRAFTLSDRLPVRAHVDSYPEETPWDADVHQEFELVIVLEGQEDRRTGGAIAPAGGDQSEIRRLGAGEIGIGAMWEPHWWRAAAPGTSDVYVQFTGAYLGGETVGRCSWFELFAPSPSDRPSVTSPALREKMLSIGLRMREELDSRQEGWEWAIRFHVLGALVELAREWAPAKAPSAQRVRHTDLHAIMPALVRVNSSLPNPVSLVEAARSCVMSRSLFCATFTRSVGVSFAKFVLRARLAWASDRLLSSDEPIAAIAAEAGFTDESHLHRSFLRYFGSTPGAYRRRRTTRPVI